MSIPQISPLEAKDILDKNSEATYVDVRSTQEFKEGHPVGAIHIALLDFQNGQMAPNPKFTQDFEAKFPKNKKLIIGCQAGGRSQRACEMLQSLGYQDVSNVSGGYGAWEQYGLPTE